MVVWKWDFNCAQIHLASIVLPLIDCIEESCGEMTVFQVERSYGLDMCTQVLDTLSLSETGVVGTTESVVCWASYGMWFTEC